MSTLADTANQRSHLWQLLALGFSHPIAAFHRELVAGSYSQTLTQAIAQAQCSGHLQHQESLDFTDFEASYIHLFQMGKGGKPLVDLNTGGHKSLSEGEDRPQFLLQYARWYKHFGLKINDSEGANELPDHLVCQLEFMAWLAHLEHTASEGTEFRGGYQCAQRDFLDRHLHPFLDVLVTSLQPLTGREQVNPLYLALAALTLEAADSMMRELNGLATDTIASDTNGNSEQIAAVNLWG